MNARRISGVRNVINVDAIAVPQAASNNTRQQLTKAQIDELVYGGGLMIITAIFILLFLIYGWIRLTNRADDDSRKKKKKSKIMP